MMEQTMNSRHVDIANESQVVSDGGDRLRIIVLGLIVRYPLGGHTLRHLQYVVGLARLGHDVYFVEDSGDEPSSYYNPLTYVTGTDATYGLRFVADTFARVGLGDRWAHYDARESRWLGPCAHRMDRVCKSADALIDVSGVNPLRPWLMQVPVRVLVDTDPAFTQIDHLTDSGARDLALQHNVFLSFGENVGSRRSAIPDDGLPWQPTRQPAVLDAWSAVPGPTGRFTTVMQWNSYSECQYDGLRYGMKSDSFAPYTDLPERVGNILELAGHGVPEAPPAPLQGKGWELRDPRGLTRDPWAYQRYIRDSKAEFSVAKHGYVISRSGWFSERSACYLASGRPVVVQDTGFSDWLESPGGIVVFRTPEEAAAAIEEVDNRYEFHCQAARAVAEEYFDHRRVLTDLLKRSL
jgi:hypothetical protein